MHGKLSVCPVSMFAADRQESTTTVFEEYPGYDGDLPLTSGGVKVGGVDG